MSALELYKKIGKSWTGCVRERDGSAYELTDDAAELHGTPASLFVPYFAPDEPDDPDQSGTKASCSSNTSYDGDYNNSYLADGSISGVTCVNGPTSPKANSDNNKRQCNTAKYKSFTCSGHGPDYNCPPSNSKITALTNTKNTITNAIDALAANGNTVIPAGLLWGWRVLSPGVALHRGRALHRREVGQGHRASHRRRERREGRAATASTSRSTMRSATPRMAISATRTAATPTRRSMPRRSLCAAPSKRHQGPRQSDQALHDRVSGLLGEPDAFEKLREQARHVLQLADQ